MASNRFKAIALVLRNHIGDVYTLLAVAEDMESFVETELAAAEPPTPEEVKSPDGHATYNHSTRLWDYDFAYLVDVARGNEAVLMYLNKSQKINAIKELKRVVPGLRLKQAKEAVEDSWVGTAAALFSDPWLIHHDNDEPPF